MTTTRRNILGFTIPELLVVTTIIFVLTLVAVGSYATFRKSRQIRSAAEMVNSAFVNARSYAIARNATHRVVFQFRNPVTGAQEYSFWVDQTSDAEAEAPVGPAKAPALPATAGIPKVVTPVQLIPEIRIYGISPIDGTEFTPAQANYVVVRFKPDGSSDSAAVHLISDSGNAADASSFYTVKLSSPTGKSRVYANAKI